jgi:predicted ester cyclase
MSLEENKALVRRWIEAYNLMFQDKDKRNLDLFDEFMAPDYFDHTNKVDREGLKLLFKIAFTGFPDWHETIEDIIAEGDKVWIRLTYTGTHTGEFMGLAPTGTKVTHEGVDIYRIADGQLVEYWSVSNQLEFMKSMGAIEVTEKGKVFFPEAVE